MTKWKDRYMEHFYRCRPGWIDGTTQFHELCRAFIKNTSRVLEVGAGPSNKTSEFLSSISASLTGLDIDAIVTSNQFLTRALVYEGDRFPFPDVAFDVVVANYVNEHLPEPKQVAREINRVLAQGGTFIFRTPNKFHYVSTVARMTPHWFHKLAANRLRGLGSKSEDPHPTFFRFNSRKDTQSILNAVGLDVIRFDLVEKEPSYGMCSRALFILFMLYERLVNSTPRLAGLRANIFCAAIKRTSSSTHRQNGRRMDQVRQHPQVHAGNTASSSGKICIVSSCGGHLAEVRMLRRVYEAYDHFYVLNQHIALPKDMTGRTHFIRHSERDWLFFVNLWEAWCVLQAERPNLIISTGAGPAVPFALIAKCLGIPFIFIEASTQVTKPSLSGRIMYYLSDRFFYQWEGLASYFPKGIYGGCILWSL